MNDLPPQTAAGRVNFVDRLKISAHFLHFYHKALCQMLGFFRLTEAFSCHSILPSSSGSRFLQHVLGGTKPENPVAAQLEKVDCCGLINQAIKTVGLSYKAAW